MSETILQIEDLTKDFILGKGFLEKKKTLKAVDRISLEIRKGETLGLVGESGCGKSTFGRCVLQLIAPTSGSVRYNGKDLCSTGKEEMRLLRQELQMIFQDPYASLNPRMTVKEIIGAPLEVYHIGDEKERQKRIADICDFVGISREQLSRYPHEFSGGQRQRIVIARALILKPKFVVCDEPVSALDVSIRSQVLNLMKDIQKEMGLSYLFISHDLSVVNHISDRVAVMYLGNLVELADKKELYERPAHPYTKALLSAIPIADIDVHREKIYLEGDVPSPLNPPSGCRFHTRCPYATERCRAERPELTKVGNGHMTACFHTDAVK